MRSPSLIRHINALTSKDFKQITISRSGLDNKPKVAESASVKLTSYPGTVRQLIVTGLGRDQPTVIIITNDHQITTRALIEVRPADDHRAAPRRDHPGILRRRPVLSSQPQRRPRRRPARPGPGTTAAFRLRLPGNYADATPDTLQRRFLDTPGEIISDGTSITVKINRGADHPVPATPTCQPDDRPRVGRTPSPLRIRLTLGPKYR